MDMFRPDFDPLNFASLLGVDTHQAGITPIETQQRHQVAHASKDYRASTFSSQIDMNSREEDDIEEADDSAIGRIREIFYTFSSFVETLVEIFKGNYSDRIEADHPLDTKPQTPKLNRSRNKELKSMLGDDNKGDQIVKAMINDMN